ncbi:MAG: SDR family NAD(P)-dependent oxidoreductase [Novosphingobium sp.]
MTRKWLITGVSSGFGQELAKAALDRGDHVAGTLRQTGQIAEFEALAPGRAHGVLLDVTDADAIAPVVTAAVNRLGGLDVLVNNAGYGMFGCIEELSDGEIRHCMETNFFGTLGVTRAALPALRQSAEREAGARILNFSSLAGMCGIPGVGIYNAAKFAVEGLSEALAIELAPFGIHTTIVEPGGFRTKFGSGSQRIAAQPMGEYAETPGGQIPKLMAKFADRAIGDPAKAVRALLAIVDTPSPPLRFAIGADVNKAITRKLAQVAQDIETWRELSEATAL